MSNSNTISIFVESQFPDFFLRDGPLLVQFIKHYYEWMEQFENPVSISRKLTEFADVDLIPDKFFRFMREEFMKNIPMNTMVDDRLLLKNIKDFYLSRGSEKSYKLLFRILYNTDVSFYYPGQDILRASDGRWVVERSLRLYGILDVSSLTTVQGQTSGASATVSRAVSYTTDSIATTEIYVTNIFGLFQAGETLLDGSGNPLGVLNAAYGDAAFSEGFSLGFTSGAISSESSALYVYPGRYEGTRGFLSSDKYLQDNYYYQEYSYQVNSTRSLKEYEPIVKSLVHPSGTKLFGGVNIFLEADFSQYPSVTDIDFSSQGDWFVVSYSFVASGQQNAYGAEAYIVIPSISSPLTVDIVSRSSIKDWLDYTPFSETLGDLPFMETHKVRWLVDNALESVVFPEWTIVEINDTTNDATEFFYAEYIISTRVFMMDKVYPFGETLNVTYKYYGEYEPPEPELSAFSGGLSFGFGSPDVI